MSRNSKTASHTKKEESHATHVYDRCGVGAVLVFSPTTFAQQTGGAAAEAKAMLMKAVAAVKADKAKALDMFNKGEGGFLDRDLYVFCNNVGDGKTVAVGNPNAKQNLGRECQDSQGRCGQTVW